MVDGAAGWEPDNDLETELWAMRQIGDRDGYLLGLARGGVLLPLSMDGGAHWVVSEISGHRCVVSFTSTDAMRRILPMPGHRPARFAELARAWPDPSMALAVDPGLPIEAFLSHQTVVDLVELAAMPDDELEERLAAAAEVEDADSYVGFLMAQSVVVPVDRSRARDTDLTDPDFPWCRPAGPTGPALIYTSERRMRDELGGYPSIEVSFADLLIAWRGTGDGLYINPASPFAMLLSGEDMAVLHDWAVRARDAALSAVVEVGDRPDLSEAEQLAVTQETILARLNGGEPAVAAGAVGAASPPTAAVPSGTAVQVVIPPMLVDRYLEHGHGRLAGLVHRPPAGRTPLADLYERLGLLGADSPLTAEDPAGYVLRWYESDPDAYAEPTMDGRDVPEGAALVYVNRDGSQRQLAVYRSAQWHPAVS